MALSGRRVDTTDLSERVMGMYREVAVHPDQEFHFKTGRGLAERLGYPAQELDRYEEAIEAAGFGVSAIRLNDRYRFLSERADNATRKYGVANISLLARKSKEESK